ncbi:hypothetical protein S58_60560 [Bradyrhizobium oligotrophicum S58]|uniref:Uncharacterized protein n=1 Tax=Bradyrhizobium oligotrophicum S58 TaxID=1245469 RepID=M4ZDX9_9BRAD|nr:hypothetical protein S58_60560 [Bradyrhizobium oligotrophicum S58]
MAVGEQDTAEPAKAHPAAEQLTLDPLAAIDENTMSACPNEKAGMIAVCRWNARRGSEESELEHRFRQISVAA